MGRLLAERIHRQVAPATSPPRPPCAPRPAPRPPLAPRPAPLAECRPAIHSSVLFMADATGRGDLKMIDFGVTTPHEAGLRHDQPWVMGNHEDGYLLGLANLIRLWNQLLVEDVWL